MTSVSFSWANRSSGADWSALFTTAYAWGLRANEVTHLQTVDFIRLNVGVWPS